MSLIDSTFKLIHDPSESADNTAVEGDAAEHINSVREILTEIIERDGKRERGAHLALMELEERLRSRGLWFLIFLGNRPDMDGLQQTWRNTLTGPMGSLRYIGDTGTYFQTSHPALRT